MRSDKNITFVNDDSANKYWLFSEYLNDASQGNGLSGAGLPSTICGFNEPTNQKQFCFIFA
jgi:hypothetical protein